LYNFSKGDDIGCEVKRSTAAVELTPKNCFPLPEFQEIAENYCAESKKFKKSKKISVSPLDLFTKIMYNDSVC